MLFVVVVAQNIGFFVFHRGARSLTLLKELNRKKRKKFVLAHFSRNLLHISLTISVDVHSLSEYSPNDSRAYVSLVIALHTC